MIIKINPKYGCKFKLEEILKIIEEEKNNGIMERYT